MTDRQNDAPSSQRLAKTYDAAFYANQMAGSLASAEITLRKLAPLMPDVRSVLDVGCGAGGWLKAAAVVFGGADVHGVDHPGAANGQTYLNPAEFSGVDLAQAFDLHRRFDLVISLEVAEHIAPERADVFVDNLTTHGPLVLFSAAAPRQGGTGHVNERWPSYWTEKFAAQGFRRHDVVRPLIWDEDAVASWYKQNAMLYVREDVDEFGADVDDWGGRALVHPGQWMRATEPWGRKIARALTGRKPSHDWRVD
ncbi:MAG: class I SAM-dependent methyltransferase [Pseudomonadota bacterium]